MQTVLTIAGFDPSSGAGITADLMVFAAHSLFGTSAITALTVQATTGVRSVHPVSAEVLSATLDCLKLDLPPAGIKIGMLATAANVRAVADYLSSLQRSHPQIPVVLDPIIRSSSGRELLDAEGVTFLREILLPCIGWITPNLDELRVWTGRQTLERKDIPEACHLLQRQVPSRTLGILATGGHLDPPDDFLLTPTGEDLWLPGTRVETRATHGTGCAFSSAFLSRLVLGDPPAEAARAAKQYVAIALQTATPRGAGHSSMNHLWPFANSKH
jgi:hydroxymethylpyrimidine/phosphomethylpyrimidine kinase